LRAGRRRARGLSSARSPEATSPIAEISNEGLATVQVSKRHDRPGIEVTTLRISDKGRKAIG
jgi:hypothetical protein